MNKQCVNYSEQLSWNIENKKNRRAFLKLWFSNLFFMNSLIMIIHTTVNGAMMELIELTINVSIINILSCVGFIFLRKWWKGE